MASAPHQPGRTPRYGPFSRQMMLKDFRGLARIPQLSRSGTTSFANGPWSIRFNRRHDRRTLASHRHRAPAKPSPFRIARKSVFCKYSTTTQRGGPPPGPVSEFTDWGSEAAKQVRRRFCLSERSSMNWLRPLEGTGFFPSLGPPCFCGHLTITPPRIAAITVPQPSFRSPRRNAAEKTGSHSAADFCSVVPKRPHPGPAVGGRTQTP